MGNNNNINNNNSRNTIIITIKFLKKDFAKQFYTTRSSRTCSRFITRVGNNLSIYDFLTVLTKRMVAPFLRARAQMCL